MIISNFRSLERGFYIYKAIVDVEYTKYLGLVRIYETREIACRAYRGIAAPGWVWLDSGEYVDNPDHIVLLYYDYMQKNGLLSE